MKNDCGDRHFDAADCINHKISVAAPDLRGNEERYVVDAIRSSWISSAGPY